ncbi:MAG TPA: DMT family transporter [Rectinemataceae bacterium]|nr:DMT family transporter [Rectinemataceae bacterium]
MKKKSSLAPLAGVAVAIIWGLTFLSTKVIVDELRPMTLALMRFVVATLLLPPIAWMTKTTLSIGWKDAPLIAASGFVGVSLYFFFENNGIMRLSASESSIIVGTIPILTLLIDMLFFRRKISFMVAAGIALSFVGVALIVIRSEAAKSSPAGYLFMVGAAISWVAYTFITKPIAGKYSLLTITFWQIFFGMIGCIPFALAEGQNDIRFSFPLVMNVLFLGVLASAVGYWLYVIVLDELGTSRSSVFINLVPVVSVVASFFILGERLAPLQLAGGLAAIAGVYLATSK